MFYHINNVVNKVATLFRGFFAAVIAGVDDTNIVRAVKTDATGKLIVSALEESPQTVVVDVEAATVAAAATTPQTEFIIADPAAPTPPPATRRFTIGASVAAGSGNIIIEGRNNEINGSWILLYTLPIAAGGIADLSYIPSWKRYRAYYQAVVNSTGVYFTVMTHPML